MIYERYIVVIICVALSNVATLFSGSLAGEAEILKSNSVANIAIAKPDTKPESSIDIDSVNSDSGLTENSTPKPAQVKPEIKTEPRTLNSQTTAKEPQRISKRWSLVGIAMTSLLSLTLLLSLFRRDDPNQDQEAGSKLIPLKDRDSSELIGGESELLDEEKIVSSQLPGIKVLDSQGKPISNKNGKSHKSIGAIAMTSTDSPDGNQSIDENLQDFIARNSQSRVEADVKEKVKIAPSNTTEIDVVFELIKDLQQSDRHLRRKAIWGLSQTADSRGIEALVGIMSQADPLDKSLIIDAISQIAHRSCQTINYAFFVSLRDPDSEVRKNAIHDLIALYEPVSQITDQLNQMTNDSDREVQQTAQWALRKFNQMFN